MKNLLFTKCFPKEYLAPTVEYILSVQTEDGSIPYFEAGPLDPWDHVESAMGLSIAGEYSAAEKAYSWMRNNQLEDGSWWSNYTDNKPTDVTKRETNFAAYVATGIWHHFLITQDQDFLESNWEMLKKAIDFVVGLQSPTGEIYWAIRPNADAWKDALITGCSSIYKSLECAVAIANTLGFDSSLWEQVYHKLGDTLRNHPECFDRTWEPKSRYSMDWFYPILTGAIHGEQAKQRINDHWDKFVVEDKGVLCYSDQPWVTVAESCELVLSLLVMGERAIAEKLFSWLHQWRDSADGAYWIGINLPDMVFWPKEKPTWTSAAVLLALDALTGATPASGLFLDNQLQLEKQPLLQTT